MDTARIERAVREILLAVGEDPGRDGLRETPVRVARSFEEMLAGMRQKPEVVLKRSFDIGDEDGAGHQELILVKNISFYSLCEHHLLPFHGSAHIGYIPALTGKVTGLSKLARLVDVYARRLQVQERLTSQIVEALMSVLKARGAIVVLEGEHMCMSMRGVRKPEAKTVTSAVRGCLHSAATRAEAMSLILGR